VSISPLIALLGAAEWRAADEETRRLLLADADGGGFSGLDPKEAADLDCDLVLAIDTAWLEASGGRFGFTPQAKIIASVRADGYLRNAAWRVFGDRVGWVQGEWVGPDQLSYTINAPTGHLPWVPGAEPTVSTGSTFDSLFVFYGHFTDCASAQRDRPGE
jgi:hypothetical protein